ACLRLFFFFSSRRRHTRFSRDWSSDVCSSDLRPVKYQTPVLLVPSLINRHYVMDLLPGKSMAEDLVASGHDVFCLDWGTPGDERSEERRVGKGGSAGGEAEQEGTYEM